eukprot:1007342-Prorocentrum_minimum.AAC.1
MLPTRSTRSSRSTRTAPAGELPDEYASPRENVACRLITVTIPSTASVMLVQYISGPKAYIRRSISAAKRKAKKTPEKCWNLDMPSLSLWLDSASVSTDSTVRTLSTRLRRFSRRSLASAEYLNSISHIHAVWGVEEDLRLVRVIFVRHGLGVGAHHRHQELNTEVRAKQDQRDDVRVYLQRAGELRRPEQKEVPVGKRDDLQDGDARRPHVVKVKLAEQWILATLYAPAPRAKLPTVRARSCS